MTHKKTHSRYHYVYKRWRWINVGTGNGWYTPNGEKVLYMTEFACYNDKPIKSTSFAIIEWDLNVNIGKTTVEKLHRMVQKGKETIVLGRYICNAVLQHWEWAVAMRMSNRSRKIDTKDFLKVMKQKLNLPSPQRRSTKIDWRSWSISADLGRSLCLILVNFLCRGRGLNWKTNK